MGFFLFMFAAGAVVAGLVLSAAIIAVALLVAVRSAEHRERVWQIAGIGSAVATVVLLFAIQLIPLRPVSPGSDYDAVAHNFVVRGFAYGVAPGIGALVGAILARLAPRRAT